MLSAFIDSNENVRFSANEETVKLLGTSVKNQAIQVNNNNIERPTLLKVMVALAKATASASVEPVIIRIDKATPEYDGTSLKRIRSRVEMSTRQKKPNLINAAEILKSSIKTDENVVISGGTRAVQGGKGARAVYPMRQPYHIAGSRTFYKMEKIMNAGRKGTRMSNKYGQGIRNAIPHQGVAEIGASSANNRVINMGLDVSAFNISQKFTNHVIEKGMRDAIIETESEVLTGAKQLIDMTVSDMANELLTNTPPQYCYQTALGNIKILQYGNRSGVPWTGTQNDFVNIAAHELAYQKFSEMMKKAKRAEAFNPSITESDYHIRVFGDDSTFIIDL